MAIWEGQRILFEDSQHLKRRARASRPGEERRPPPPPPPLPPPWQLNTFRAHSELNALHSRRPLPSRCAAGGYGCAF